MERTIIGFHQDEQGHWVADLECGHTRHVRHDPPWQNRAWVLTTEGRSQWLGTQLNCVRCEEYGNGERGDAKTAGDRSTN